MSISDTLARPTRLQQLGALLHSSFNRFEENWLAPAIHQLFVRYGDPRQKLVQTLQATNQPAQLSPADRTLNRGLAITGLSAAAAVAALVWSGPLQLLSLPGLAYGSWHLYAAAYQNLRTRRRPDINLLIAMVNTAYITGGYWALGNFTVLSFFFNAKLLNTLRDQQAQTLIDNLVSSQQNAHQQVDGVAVDRKTAELQVGDVVVVYAGEIIPVDGQILHSESAAVAEDMLTGESHPVEKQTGDRVFAATLLLTGRLEVRVEQDPATALAGRVGQLLAQTADYRSTHQLRMDQLTDRLMIPTLGAAALTLPLLGPYPAAAMIDLHPFRQLSNFGAIGLLNSFLFAAEHKILIKDGRTFELLPQIDTIVFDKTGTLTESIPLVAALHTLGTTTESELLTYAAAAEQHQTHPIAHAILAATRAHNLPVLPLDDAELQVGLGVIARMGGHTIHVGSARFLQQQGVAFPALPTLAGESQAGLSQVWVARDGHAIGAIELSAVLRAEVPAMIAQLREQTSIRSIIVVSGDRAAATRQLAAQIGADDFYAEALPTDKLAILQHLQATGHNVCFVGDGINDAIAFRQANVSVSIAGATPLAMGSAHAVLLEPNLTALPALFKLAKEAAQTQRAMQIPVLGTSALGLIGIWFWGWSLPATTALNLLSIGGGLIITMLPRLAAARQTSIPTT